MVILGRQRLWLVVGWAEAHPTVRGLLILVGECHCWRGAVPGFEQCYAHGGHLIIAAVQADQVILQQLLDRTRQGMARRYLTDSSISMTQLAGMLGYSDLSAFSRAFQRWFGVSPKGWQARELPGQSVRRRRLLAR